MDNNQKRTMLALLLSGLVLFVWQSAFAPKNIDEEQVISDNTSSVKVDSKVNTETISETSDKAHSVDTSRFTSRDAVELRSKKASFKVLPNFSFVELTGYKTQLDNINFSGRENFFQVGYVDVAGGFHEFNFSFQEIANASSIEGYDSSVGAKLNLRINDKGLLEYVLTTDNPIRLSIVMRAKEGQSDNRTYRQFISYTQEVTRINVEDDDTLEGNMKWVGLDFNHHVFLNVFNNKLSSKFKTDEDGRFVFNTLNPARSFEGFFLYSLKEIDYLATVKNHTELSIDFGLFGILAVPILKSMKFIYTYVSNYGFAIIILTIIIRLLTYPLQFKSFKNMKKMQVVQPELTKLREKYKDNPQEMQKRTMELFKRSGANPLGGCFPMLLQVPIFIAFYQAISNSVELVGSPFAFWLTDLSAKDPFYVLPVLMGATMFFQTKLNPSTSADPNQQKIMYIMPLVFCFMMKDLPAGLNLYFFVSNLVGIGQQVLVYRMVD